MANIKCDKCGCEEFIRVFSIPVGKGTRPVLEEKRLVCYKCDDELTAKEVNKALENAQKN